MRPEVNSRELRVKAGSWYLMPLKWELMNLALASTNACWNAKRSVMLIFSKYLYLLQLTLAEEITLVITEGERLRFQGLVQNYVPTSLLGVKHVKWSHVPYILVYYVL